MQHIKRKTSRCRNHKILKAAVLLLTSIFFALAGVYLLGPSTYNIEGLTLKFSLVPSCNGQTVIKLPPFGSISAFTHNSPLQLNIELLYIGTDLARELLKSHQPSSFIEQLRIHIPGLIPFFIFKQIILALASAFVMTYLIWRSSFKQTSLSSIAAIILLCLVLWQTFATYDIRAFKEPEYSGVIAVAPNLIPEPDKLLSQLDEVQKQTRRAVSNIKVLFAHAENFSLVGNPAESSEVKKVLVVSDLHSNPVGIEFITSLAQSFKVDLIIDAGDLTDFGSEAEIQAVEKLKDLDIPYVFASGNHDTPETSAFIKSLKKGIILKGTTVEVSGLKILGTGDPLSESQEVVITDEKEWEKTVLKKVPELLDQKEEKPDIAVIHHHKAALELVKTFPLVIHGHSHRLEIAEESGNIRINPGTAGAAGLRGLYAEKGVPYSAVILYIKPGEKLLACDIVKYDPLSDRFFIERKLFKNGVNNNSSIPEE